MQYMIAGLITLFIGFQIGWHEAHLEVARECDKLGGFYVGNNVYRCDLDPIQPKGK